MLDGHKKPSIIRPRVFKGSGISFVSCIPHSRKIIGAPQRAFSHVFLPACHEKDISGQVFSRWRCKQKLSYAFSWSLASLYKKIQLISLIFAHFDAKKVLRGKKVKFREKTRKVNFLI